MILKRDAANRRQAVSDPIGEYVGRFKDDGV
jgi:hypothetical protein